MRVRMSVVILFVLLGVTALVASDLNKFGVADQRNVTFYSQVKIGDTVVPAGDYKVLHVMEGEEHVMLFKQLGASKDKAITVKTKCTLKPLPSSAKENQSMFRTENGVQVLTLLQFKGDKAQHVF